MLQLYNRLLSFVSRYSPTLILISPILFVLFLAAHNYETFQSLQEAQFVDEHLESFEAGYVLISTLQVERGTSAAFVSTPDQSNQQLLARRQLTNEAFNNFKRLVEEKSDVESPVFDLYRLVISRFSNVQNIRPQVDSRSVSRGDVVGTYTELVNDLISGYVEIELMVNDTVMFAQIGILKGLVDAQEFGGLQRANLSSIFGAGEATTRDVVVVSSLTSSFNNAIKASLSLDSDGTIASLSGILQTPESQNIAQWVDSVYSNSGFDAATAAEVFSTATTRLQLIIEQNKLIKAQMLQRKTDIIRTSLAIVIVETLLMILIIVVTVFISGVMRLGRKQSQAFATAAFEYSEKQDLRPEIELITRDQLGLAAISINSVIGMMRHNMGVYADVSHNLAAGAEQTAVAVQETQSSLMEQQMEMSSIASASEEMSASITDVSDRMAENIEIVSTAMKETRAGEVAVEKAVVDIRELAKEVNDVGENIENLNGRLQGITSIVEMIQGIAEQTNLLALNAAIEAARAGEQGRGFAVVADEVRSLAQRTREATEEISTIVGQLNEDAAETISVIETGRKTADRSIDSANNITEVLSRVVENMSRIEQLTDEVNTATQQQNAVTTEIADNVHRASERATVNAEAAQQIADTTAEQERLAIKINDLISQYQT